jgi:hypothetical protein
MNTAGQHVCEPPLNTPCPGYYGYGLATRLASPGARLVLTTGAPAPIVTHAAVQPNGKIVVLVENEDPASAHDVALHYDGYRPLPPAPAFTYGPGVTVTSSGVGAPGAAQHDRTGALTRLSGWPGLPRRP